MMSITVDLPENVAADIARHAQVAGQTIEVFAAEALKREIASRELQQRQQLEDIEWALSVHRLRK